MPGFDGVTNLLPSTATTVATAGTYVPTFSSTSNCSSPLNKGAFYLRIGNVVQVWGHMTLQITANTADVIFNISLPIASTLSADGHINGVGAYGSVSSLPLAIYYFAAAGSVAHVSGRPTAAAGPTGMLTYHFAYQVF